MNLKTLILAMLLLGFFCLDSGFAQPGARNWEVGRVYVPSANLQSHLPPDYWPIEVKELDRQLEQLRNNDLLRQVNPTTIDTAFYVATVNRDILISDASYWSFAGNELAGTPVGRVSFALRDAKGIPEDRRQLSTDQRFATDGSIEVDLSAGKNQLWFGFQAVSSLQGKNRSFKLKLPRAALAQMLISADSGLKLSSAEVVIKPVTSPADHLPADWPAALAPRLSPRQSWWLVYLSGVSEFSISVSEFTGSQQQEYLHAISSAVLSHQIKADSLSTTATFKFATESNGQPIVLDLDRSQKIRSISVDGRLIDWRTLEANENRTLAELSTSTVSIDSVVEVQAITPLAALRGEAVASSDSLISDDVDFRIPAMFVANSTVLSGTTTIRGDDTTAVVKVSGAPEFRKSATDPTNAATSLLWRAQWSGKPAGAQVKLQPQVESWTTSSFCRLNIQERSVLAQLNLSLTGSALRSNQLRLPVHPGWSVDSISLPKDSSNQLRAFSVNDGGRDEVIITWQGQPNLLITQLQIVASAPIDAQTTSFAIQHPRIIQAPDPNSPAYWTIQNSSNFRLRSNVDLLPIVVAKRDLAAWQQQLIPEENITVYRDLSDANSRFVFDAAAGWISAIIATVVEPQGLDRLRLITLLNCQPNSGAVDRVLLELPPGQNPEQWKFSFTAGNETGIPVQAISSKDTSAAQSNTMELRLPISTSNPFRLQASLDLAPNPSPESVKLPIPGMSTANGVESVVILPARLAHFSDETSVELLASTSCCSADMLTTLSQLAALPVQSTSPQENWVTANVDGSQAHLLTLLSASANQRSSWIWSESLVHDLTNSGYCRHTLEVDVQTGSINTVALNIPREWQPDLLVVDEVERQDFFWAPGKLEIDLPVNRRNRLKIQFHSKQPILDWLTEVTIGHPQYEVPVLQRSEQLKLPLANLAMIQTHAPQNQLIIDRMKPWFWWHVFSPGSAFSALDQQGEAAKPTYDLTNRQSIESDSIWILNRDALSTLLLTALLAAAALNWFLIRWSARLWWLCNLTVLSMMLVVPEPLAMLGQVLLLSAILSVLARMIEVVTRRPPAAVRQSPMSSQRAVASLWLVALIMPVASAQTTDEPNKERQPKIFGVVIPYEDSLEAPNGEYAWIPKELRDLLPGAGTKISSKQSSPKYLSASYVMKMRQNPRDNTPIQELTVELKVLATDTTTGLLLPFRPESLKLSSSPELNGQPRLPGIRYFELTNEGILFRPDATGVMTIVLSFQPLVEESAEQKYKFATSIPPIPNATLRIVPNSQTSTISVNAQGGMQRLPSGDYIAHLGAIDKLELDWAENDRSSSTLATEYTTETWVHAQADSIAVACQLTIERGRSLPEEFELIVDADWEPVGTKWGEADLVSSTISATLKRRVVRIRLSETAGLTCRLRMLLAHRSNARASMLDVPFVSLDRVASKGKLFWWSAEPNSTWTAEGLESMPARTSTSSDWGELKIATERAGYQVIGSGVRLRQQSLNTGGSVVELTSLHLFVSHTDLEYEATWERTTSLYEELAVNIPPGSEFKRLEINGKSSTTFSRQLGVLRIPLTTSATVSTRVKLVFELPPMQQLVQQLPRVQLKNLQTRQSNYQIYRGTGLDVQLLPTDSGLVFTSAPTSSRRPRLERLETFVGEANLPPEMLSESVLNAKLQIQARAAVPHQSFVEYLERVGSGWKATIRCSWSAQASGLDYAFFDVPLSLRDSIETGSQVCIFKPHEDPTRTNLCIPIPPLEAPLGSGRSVEFSFLLNSAVSTRSITLPRITANHGFVSTPVIALPKKVDGVEVRWARLGKIVEESWFNEVAVARNPDLEYLSLLPNQTKLVWQAGEADHQVARVELICLDVTSSTANNMAGIVNYWLVPQNQVTQQFEIPSDCEILGVDCDHRRTTWSVDGTRLRVTLQPNLLPLSIRIMAQWKVDSQQATTLVQLPRPLDANVPSQIFLAMSENSNWSVLTGNNVTTVNKDAVVDRWAAIVVETAESLASLPEPQSSNWLANWYPGNHRIRDDILIDLPALENRLSTFDTNDDGVVSVGELWSRTESLARNADYSTDKTSQSLGSGDFAGIQWRIQGSEVRFSQRADIVEYDPLRWLAALALAGIGLIGLYVGGSLKRGLLTILSTQPWFYWTLLAALLWFALPISWPAWFVFGLSLWMWLMQLIDQRRRTRRFGF